MFQALDGAGGGCAWALPARQALVLPHARAPCRAHVGCRGWREEAQSSWSGPQGPKMAKHPTPLGTSPPRGPQGRPGQWTLWSVGTSSWTHCSGAGGERGPGWRPGTWSGLSAACPPVPLPSLPPPLTYCRVAHSLLECQLRACLPGARRGWAELQEQQAGRGDSACHLSSVGRHCRHCGVPGAGRSLPECLQVGWGHVKEARCSVCHSPQSSRFPICSHRD